MSEEDKAQDESWPDVPKLLLDKMNEIWPERCPELNQTEAQIREYTGSRKVVRKLIKEWEFQNKCEFKPK